MDNKEIFARNLRALRIERGLSQGQLARHAGVSQALVARMENGTRNPKIETVMKIARALDAPIFALYPDYPIKEHGNARVAATMESLCSYEKIKLFDRLMAALSEKAREYVLQYVTECRICAAQERYAEKGDIPLWYAQNVLSCTFEELVTRIMSGEYAFAEITEDYGIRIDPQAFAAYVGFELPEYGGEA